MMKVICLFTLLMIPNYVFGCICFHAPLKQIIEKNNNRPDVAKDLFIKAKILGRNTTVYGVTHSVNAVNVQIQEYWYHEDLKFETDTLTIFDDALCGSNFKQGLTYLIVATRDEEIYRTSCGEHLILSSVEDDLHLLGSSLKVKSKVKSNQQNLMKEYKIQLGLKESLLILSVLLNILLLSLLIKKKSKT